MNQKNLVSGFLEARFFYYGCNAALNCAITVAQTRPFVLKSSQL